MKPIEIFTMEDVMPRGDGTGPTGNGPISGGGGGRGRMGGELSAGLGGKCVCPKCNKEINHQRGAPCNSIKCPDCGANMTRAT